MKRLDRRRRGIATIWLAIFGIVLIGFTGLATDTGYVYLTAQQLQNAADAAALAAGQHLLTDQLAARQLAVTIGLANSAAGDPVQLDPNPGNAAYGDVVFGTYNRASRVFTATTTSPNAVKVNARRTAGSLGGGVPLFFGGIFGVDEANVSRTAIAVAQENVGSGLIVLSDNKRAALNITGTAVLTITGGAVQVNSDHVSALEMSGTSTIIAEVVNVAGNVYVGGGASIEGQLNTGAAPVADPFAGLAAPTWDPGSDLGEIRLESEETVDMTPGYYSGGITALGGTINMSPGVYILDGAGLNIGGGGSLIADGVTLHIVGDGRIDLSGNGVVQITPPDSEVHSFPGADVYEGVSLFQARDNTSEAHIAGTASFDMEGLLYFPSNNVDVTGTGLTFGNQVVADSLQLGGNSEITIPYIGEEGAGGTTVFLVR
ncbi:MAG: hypothetical protein HQ592_16960 [Planctomycetes bacterium]|nr:hypothetical protein [Planctomycetota bacterium]